MANDQLDLLDKMAEGALVLTANRRLTRYLESCFEEHQRSRGRTAWRRPSVFPFEAWCQQQYSQLHNACPVVSRAQGALLWEQIVEDSVRQSRHELLQVAATAQVAWKAEQLLVRYQTSFKSSEGTEDQLMFLQWQSAWHARLGQLSLVDAAALPLLLTESIESWQELLPHEVVFAGFDDFDRSVLALQQGMKEAGHAVTNHQPHYFPDSRRERFQCPDQDSEVRRCAQKVKELLLQDATCRIGIVAPNLSRYREKVESVFRIELDPHGFMFAGDEPPPFNISESPSLADEPVVHLAIQVLRMSNLLEVDELGILLRSPYLVDAESAGFKRAACDRELRTRRQASFRLDSLGEILRGGRNRKMLADPAFIDFIEFVSGYIRSSKAQLPGAWAERFAALLDKAGWPGERTLSSREYQAAERFRRLLGEMASLDRLARPMSRQEAANRLSRMAGDAEFQPEGAPSGVSVVGMLEASGMQFDYLWILGMHAGAMPRRPQPNPFIPLERQRRLGMPHADAARELVYSEKTMARLFAAAPVVLSSWPQSEEGMPVSMAPCLKNLPDHLPVSTQIPIKTYSALTSGTRLERYCDTNAPPITSRKPISGGTSIIKDQALCPFRAFAHHRLRAEALESVDIGIDAMTRGTLVHKVLELFWREIRTQQKMLELTPDQLRQLLVESADKSVARYRWRLPEGQQPIEIERLVSLCLKWLDVERKRTGFEVVEWEQEHIEMLGRLKIRAIIDRIDQLENGRLAIVDYKTGRPDPSQWFNDRITEPQMPIYCQQLDPDRIEAVTFAIVRPGRNECKFRGIARNSSDWPGINDKSQEEMMADRGWSSFAQVLENWRRALPELGNDFMDGVAQVDPYDPEISCRYCDLVPLCRIHEADSWSREVENG